MPFTEKVAMGPYKERMQLHKWLDEQDIHSDAPYETIIVEVWYDEYNMEITDPTRIHELEQKILNS